MDNDQTRLPDEGPKASLLSAGKSFGQYRVVRLLGRGGMGEAYEVAHPVLEKRFVLKLLSPEIMSRPDAAERFKREAKVMARLEHPNIVKVDDFGETDGLTWLRMELMEGWQHEGKSHQSLQSLIKECAPLPESLVTQLVGQILKGLGEAHGKGAIHRDIKPSNILLQPNSLKPNGLQSKITDFGLVSLAGADWLQSQVQLTVARSMAQPADPDATRLDPSTSSGQVGSGTGTSTQALLGTYAYMSPEQKKGIVVDARSDLYAVALIAFQMLTGEETLGMETPSDIVDGLDPSWDDWIKRGIATRPDRRFQNTSQMLDLLPGNSAVQVSPAIPAPFELSEEVGAKAILEPDPEKRPEIPPESDEAIESADREESEPAHAEVEPPEDLQTYQDQDSEVEATGKEADIAHDAATSKRSFPLAWLIIVLIPILGLAAYFFSGNGGTVEKPEAVSRVVSQVDSVQQPGVDPPADKAIKVTGPESGRDWTVDLGSGERMNLKWIAPGSFQMGSNDGGSDEKPVHRVSLSQGYWLGEHEVTQGEWQALMGSNPSHFKGTSLPVEKVSWEDAMEFCRKLTARERSAGRLPAGLSYTLPTEAQWEYAARAGTTGAYAGDLDAMGWYNSGSKTHPVGQKRANAWGLYDMHGNVWEWCLDWYGDYPSGSVVDPSGASSGSGRVLRGGSWFSNAGDCRSADRSWDTPGIRLSDLGFRLALSVNQ